MRSGGFLGATLALAMVIAAGCNPPQSSEELVNSYNPHGQTMVFVIDTSKSMDENDPRRYTMEAPQVALAIANQDDNIGVITFSNGASAVLPMQEVKDFDKRRIVQASMRDVAKYRAGGTNYSAALGRTDDMLRAARSTPNSNVFFLTDGKPDDNPEEIDQAAYPFSVNRWRINTVGLTLESDNDSLGRMQTLTGGVKKIVVEAKDLLESYIRVALAVNNYWEFSMAPNSSPVTLLPGAKRLIYIGIRNREDTGANLAGVLNKGVSVDLAAKGKEVFRYPPVGADWRTNYQVINIENPAPGVYMPEVQGKVEIFRIMMEPPYDFDFKAGSPPPIIYGGDPVTIEAVVQSSTPEGLAYFEKNGEIGLSGAFDNDGTPIFKYTEFTEKAHQTVEGKDVLVYTHIFYNFDAENMGEKDRPVRLTLIGKVHAAEGSEGLWTSERTALVSYRPGDKIHPFAFTPNNKKLGDVWSDGPVEKLAFKLEAVRGESLTYKIETEPKLAGFKAEPNAGTLKFEQTVTVNVTPDFSAAPTGPVTVKLVATATIPNANVAPEAASITANVYKIEVKPIELKGLRAGATVRSTQPVQVTITPAQKFDLAFEAAKPEAKGLLKLVEQGGQTWIEAKLPDGFSGDAGGSLVVTVPGTSLPPKKIAVPAMLIASEPSFTSVTGLQTIEGKPVLLVDAKNPGVSNGSVTFTPKDVADAEFKVSLSSLKDRNNNDVFKTSGEVPPVRFELPPGIDPAKLADGKPVDVKYSVFVSSDIPADTYQGKLMLQFVKDGKVVAQRAIDIEVHVGSKR